MVTVHVCGDYGLGQVFPTPVLPSPTWALVLCFPNMSMSSQMWPSHLLLQDRYYPNTFLSKDLDYWASSQCYLNTGLTKTSEPWPSVIPNTGLTKTAGSLPPFWCLSWGEAGAASPGGRHHQFQLWWVCHPVVLLWVISKIYWEV